MEDMEHEFDTSEQPLIPHRGHILEAETLMHPIKDWMRTNIGAVSPRDSVSDAVQQMVRGHYGCVLVIEDSKLVGIFSERDILSRVVHEGLNPNEVTVGDNMTRDPETLRPDDGLAYALNIMTVGGFRHVPIVDDKGVVEGILSIRDIQKLLVSHFQEEILTLPPLPVRNPPTDRYGG